MAFHLPHSYSSASIIHRAIPDKVIKEGRLEITAQDLSLDEFEIILKYKIKAKILFITKKIEGESREILPMKFRYLYGYEELEKTGSMIHRDVLITHMGKRDVNEYTDCHLVHVKPLKNNKWEGILTFCPEVPSVGFAKTQLTYKNIPVLKVHTMKTELLVD